MTSPTDLSLFFLETQPAGAGRVLEGVAPEDAAALVEQAPSEIIATVLANMQPGRAVELLVACQARTAAQILTRVAPHARTTLLRALPLDTTDEVLNALPSREAATLRRYLAYDPGTAGAWMSAPKVRIEADATVGQTLQRMRALRDRPGPRLFAVSKGNKLAGYLDLDALLVADDGDSIVGILRSDTATLSPYASLAAVVQLEAWDTSLVMPVTDRAGRLLGVLTFDAVRDGLEAGRTDSKNPQGAMMFAHLSQALLVSVSGMVQTAVTPPVPQRIDGEAA